MKGVKWWRLPDARPSISLRSCISLRCFAAAAFGNCQSFAREVIETAMKGPFVTLLCRFAEMSVAYDQSSVSQSSGGENGMILPSRDD